MSLAGRHCNTKWWSSLRVCRYWQATETVPDTGPMQLRAQCLDLGQCRPNYMARSVELRIAKRPERLHSLYVQT